MQDGVPMESIVTIKVALASDANSHAEFLSLQGEFESDACLYELGSKTNTSIRELFRQYNNLGQTMATLVSSIGELRGELEYLYESIDRKTYEAGKTLHGHYSKTPFEALAQVITPLANARIALFKQIKVLVDSDRATYSSENLAVTSS